MKTRRRVWKIGLTAVLALAGIPGCGIGPFPGGELHGPEMSLKPAPNAADVSIVRLETRPDAPYSVRVQLFSVDGAFFLDPAPERQWLHHIETDPRVRLQFSGDPAVYLARAEEETRAEILEQFDPGAVVLRLIPD